MKKTSVILLVLLCTFAGAMGAAVYAEKKYSTPSYSAVVFSTLFSKDTSSDIESREQASTYFGESIIGWTLAPNFSKDLGFYVGARKQERQNIVFQFSSPSQEIAIENAEKLQKFLSQKLEIYNTSSNSQFELLFDKPSISKDSPKKFFWSIGGGIVGLFFALFFVELFGYFNRGKKKKRK